MKPITPMPGFNTSELPRADHTVDCFCGRCVMHRAALPSVEKLLEHVLKGTGPWLR